MYVCVHDSRIVWVTNNNRQKMTEILLEIQSDKLNASTQDAGEFLGYLRRRGSTATGSRRASMTSGESQEEQEQAPDTTQKGRSKTDREASTSASKRKEDKKLKEQTKGVFSLRRSFLGRTNSKDMGEARKRMARVNSLNVLNSIGFLMRNAGAYDDDHREDWRALSIGKVRSGEADLRHLGRRRNSVFQREESLNDYVEMSSEVWNTVKVGLLNEALDRYSHIVMSKLRTEGDENRVDDLGLSSLTGDKIVRTFRSSMHKYDGNEHTIPHFLDILKNVYEQHLSKKLNQDNYVRKLRRRLWILLSEPESTPLAMLISIIVLLTIVLSSTVFCLETMEHSSQYQRVYTTLDIVCGCIFCAEYFTKCTSAPNIRAMLTPMNLIDLIALLPFFIELAAESIGFDTRIFRVVRLVRIFRMLKFGGRVMKLDLVTKAVSESSDMLGMMLLLLAITITIFSTLVFYCERGSWDHFLGMYVRDGETSQSPYSSIPYSFWWCVVTLTSVGYGDVVPISLGGRIVATVAMVSSVIILALPISVIGTNFTQTWTDYKEKMREIGDSPSALAQINFSIKSPQLSQLLGNVKAVAGASSNRKSSGGGASKQKPKAFNQLTNIQSFESLLGELKEQGNDVMLIAGQMGKVLSSLDMLMTHTKQQFIIEETTRKMIMTRKWSMLRDADEKHEASSPLGSPSAYDRVDSAVDSGASSSAAGSLASSPTRSPRRTFKSISFDKAGGDLLEKSGSRNLQSLSHRDSMARPSAGHQSASSRLLMKQAKARKVRIYDPDMQESMEKIESLLNMFQALAAMSSEITVRSCGATSLSLSSM